MRHGRLYRPQGTWSLLSFTVYPPSGAPVEMKGEGTLSIDDFGYVMMTLNADAASAALLTKAGIPMEKNRFFTWGKTIVDKRNQTLKYVNCTSSRGSTPLSRPGRRPSSACATGTWPAVP